MHKYGTFILFVLLTAAALAESPQQPAKELQSMLAKYPHENAVVDASTANITIAIVNGKPLVTHESTTSVFLLAENPTNWADGREYAGGHTKLKTMEAYSLVPEKSKYRKIAVTNFTKTAETGDGIFFDDQQVYLFTYPSVGQGTKLVSKTVMESDKCQWPYSFYFGRGVPTQSASITVTCPAGVSIAYRLYGYDTAQVTFTKTALADKTVYRWEARDLKAYHRDVMAPSFRYFTPHLQIAIAGYEANGQTVRVMGHIDDLYKHSYNYLASLSATCHESVKQLTDSLAQPLTTDADKVRSIFYWVQKNIKYVAIEDGDNGFVPREAQLVLQRRYGDCKDKSSLLVAMMRSQGIDAGFVWVGSRELPYRYSQLATPYVDDHMVACWWKSANEPVILDGTTHFHRMEDVPAFIQGKECLIERGPDSHVLYLIPVAPASANLSVDSVFVSLQNDTLVGMGKAYFTGEEKANLKRRFSGRDAAKYNEIVPLVLPKASNKLLVDETTISDPQNNDQPFALTYRFRLPNYVSASGNNTYVNMNIDRMFQSLQIRPDRWLPVEVEYTMHRRFVCVLTLPRGKEAASLPNPVKVSFPLFGFEQSYTRHQNQIVLTTDVHFDALLVEHEHIAQMRQLLSQLTQTYQQSIVLTKN